VLIVAIDTDMAVGAIGSIFAPTLFPEVFAAVGAMVRVADGTLRRRVLLGDDTYGVLGLWSRFVWLFQLGLLEHFELHHLVWLCIAVRALSGLHRPPA
jgi:hypothetical protein